MALNVNSAGEFETVASAINGFDETGLTGIGLEFGAQVTNVNSDCFNVIVRFIAPDFLEDQRRLNGLAMALKQTVEKFKLQMGQADRTVEPDRLEPFRNQCQWAVTEDFTVVTSTDRSSIAAT